MQKTLIIIVAIAVIGAGIYFYIESRGNKTTIEIKYPDGTTEKVSTNDRSCRMVGWENKVGLSFSFDVLKKYQGSGGFNFDASQIRQLDDLQTDFGLQFEALCKDYQAGFYKSRESLYDCRRANVGNALAALRQLKITLEPIKNMQDAAAQKDVVTTALKNYYAASAGNFSKDCNPRALNVDRKEVRFSAAVNQQTVGISNGGFFDMTWEAANTPHNFLCQPTSSKIGPSKNDTLVVYRLHGNVDTAAQTLTVHDNFNETAELKIIVEDGSASTAILVKDIQDHLNSAPNTDLTATALATVKKNYPSASEGIVDWITGELLDKMGNPAAAKFVLQKAGQDPALKEQPQYKLDLGTILIKTGNRNESKSILDGVSRDKDEFYATQATMVMHLSDGQANRSGNAEVFTPDIQSNNSSGFTHPRKAAMDTAERVKSNAEFEKVKTADVPK